MASIRSDQLSNMPDSTTIPSKHYAIETCSLGYVLIAGSEKGICAILLGDNPEELTRELQKKFPRTSFSQGKNNLAQAVKNVVNFIESATSPLSLPLDIQGTPFQQRVWEALRNIPPGSTASYTEIANAIDAPTAARAVAKACAANPLAVVIPCHRIIKQDGSLSGYRWGIHRKKTLLLRESKSCLS